MREIAYDYDKDYDYNKNEIKENIEDEQMFDFLAELGAEPQWQKGNIINKTICHCGESHKLYYYSNSKLFKCYTDCGGDAFDIFELVRKVKGRGQEDTYQLPQAIHYVAQYFGYAPKFDNPFDTNDLEEDWKIFNKYDRIKEIKKDEQIVELKEYDGSFLKNFPKPKIKPWLDEGITQEVMNHAGICFDSKNYGIIIPHYDINNRLIGIRERTMDLDMESGGKYKPAYINKKLYNHPLSLNLYNLNNSKDNIKSIKKAIVFEGEKSSLLYRSYFGEENDISVGCCGSSLVSYQVKLLISLGVEEIIIAFDKQFQEKGDDEFKKLVKNLTNINKKYGKYTKISFMFDSQGEYLDYKDAPIDKGQDVFLKLYTNRIFLY